MILDAGRTEPYVRALRSVVKPGSVVLDIGTGTGLFALLACRFGARRVFAVEPGDAIDVAREMAAANGFSDRIQFFRAFSTAIDLPERADVVIAEIHGVLPLFERYLVTLADARRRLLAPGGTMIPARERIWASPVDAAELFERSLAPWTESTLGIDMTAARRLMTNDLWRADFEAKQLLAQPVCVALLDYSRIEDANVSSRVTMTVSRPGVGHGIALWFDTTVLDGIEMSSAPSGPRLIFGNAMLPWPQPVSLRAGDEIEVHLEARLIEGRYLWSWETRVSSAEGVGQAFRQSQFFGAPLSPATLRRRAASFVPRLGVEGEIDHLVLQLMSERKRLGEIAEELAKRHPDRFPRWQDALDRVGALSDRLSE